MTVPSFLKAGRSLPSFSAVMPGFGNSSAAKTSGSPLRCGTLTARSWSTDGVWCARCAPAGHEGRYCAVCAKVYDVDDPDAQAMVECERCGLWVHDRLHGALRSCGWLRGLRGDSHGCADEHDAAHVRAMRRTEPVVAVADPPHTL